MIDLSVKLAAVAAVAWLATRRVTPAQAAAAHRVWMTVLVSPVLWLAAHVLFPPVVLIRPRGEAVGILAGTLDGVWPAAVGVYFAVLAVHLVRILYGVVAVHRLVRGAAPLPAADRDLISHQGLEIREADVAVPVTAGFLRPVVLLPFTWRRISSAGLTAILRHEAAHVRRRDPLMTLACALLEAVFWVHPAIWVAGSKVRWFAEMACDAAAARAMRPGEYASELLALAAEWQGARTPAYAITTSAASGVSRRIGLLIDEIEQTAGRRRLLPIAGAVVLVVVTLGAALRVDATGRMVPSLFKHDNHSGIQRLHHGHATGHR
jgi:beta-lactamase regulating signal transducer with metallopeptidase domain